MNIEIANLKSAILPQFEYVIYPYDERKKNPYYYKKYCHEWKKQWVKEIQGHQSYDQVDKDLILEFVKEQTLTMLNTAKLFKLVYRYKEPSPSLLVKISIAQGDVERSLNDIGYFENQMKRRVRQKEHSLALDLQYDLLLIWEESLNIMKANFRIDVFKSPMGSKFKAAEEKLKKAVKKQDIDLLYRLKVTEQSTKLHASSPHRDLNEFPWFKVGLKFATGEAYQLRDQYRIGPVKDGSFVRGYFDKITLDMGLKKTDRPWVSDTFNEASRQDSKNILADPIKVDAIYRFCIRKKISMCSKFLSHLPPK